MDNDQIWRGRVGVHRGRRERYGLFVVLLALAASVWPAAAAGQVFTSCPTPVDYSVPLDVASLAVQVNGAGGGGGGGSHGGNGSGGGSVSATVPVTPGDTILVHVGCAGAAGGGANSNAAGGGGGATPGGNGGAGSTNAGFNGNGGGGGGAASYVTDSSGQYLVVGGGGGGGGGEGISSSDDGADAGSGGNPPGDGSDAKLSGGGGGTGGGSASTNGTNGGNGGHGTFDGNDGGGGGGGGGYPTGGQGGKATDNDAGGGGGGGGWSFAESTASGVSYGSGSGGGGAGAGGANGSITINPNYETPQIGSITPISGSTLGGTNVTITGSQLAAVTAVKFGNNVATNVSCTETSCTATSPAGVAGTVDVTATNPGGTSAAVAGDQFTYVVPPTLTSASPNNGPIAGGNTVTLTGTHLANATVKFGTTTAGTCPSTATTSCSVNAPAGAAAGAVTVTATTAGGSATVGYTYNPKPTITSSAPTTGVTDGGQAVTLTGTGLTGGTVFFGSTSAGACQSGSTATSCITTSPATATAGNVTITVQTTAGGTSTGVTFQYFFAPTLTSFTPTTGPAAGGTNVTVTGTHLLGATIKFGTASAGNCGNDAGCVVSAPAGTGGASVSVSATHLNAPVSSPAQKYTYVAAPTITGVSPSSGPAAGGNQVTINGTNLAGGTVKLNGTTTVGPCATGSTATACKVTLPAGTGGATINLSVTTVGGSAGGASYTYVAAPQVGGIVPSSGPDSGGTNVTIHGGDLTNGTVKFGSTSAGTCKSGSTASSCTVLAPAGTGTVDVTVSTIGGTSSTSAVDKYTYLSPLGPPPTVTAISPASGPSAGGTAVTITGTNLTAGSVAFGSTPAGTCMSGSTSTSCLVEAPAGTGTVHVTVTGPGGTSTASPADQYTYIASSKGSDVPSNTAPPRVGGTARQGQTLTEAHGTWTNSPTAYVLEWQRCDATGGNCVSIPGASGPQHVLTADDAGHAIRVAETASNADGKADIAATSAPTSVVHGLPVLRNAQLRLTASAIRVKWAIHAGGGGAPGIKSVTLALPKGLTFNAKALAAPCSSQRTAARTKGSHTCGTTGSTKAHAAGVKVSGGGSYNAHIHRRKLVISFAHPFTSATFSAGSPAITVGGVLASRKGVKRKHAAHTVTLNFAVGMVDAAGLTTATTASFSKKVK